MAYTDIDVCCPKKAVKLYHSLTQLVTPYSDRDLGQHCLWYWLVASWDQAITWTNVYLSSCIFLTEISWDITDISH